VNLDLVRSIYAAWGKDDYRSMVWADAEIEFVKADGPDPGSWRGVRETSRVWTENRQSFEEFHTVADAYRELDAERVLVLSRLWGRGRKSQLEVGRTETEGASVFELRGGKVARLVLYWDREHAFVDLGLSREGEATEPPGQTRRLISLALRVRTLGRRCPLRGSFAGAGTASALTGASLVSIRHA
jgi:ketosteroid isomerase-like protein